MRFQGKVALVTGGSRGIGRATCLALAAEGAAVIVHYWSHREAAEGVVSEITGAGGSAWVVRADVRDEAEVAAMATRVTERFGRLHLLVNNAGDVRRARTEEVEVAEWRRILDVNLTGTFLCTRHLLGALRAAGKAAVVNVSSIAGVRGGALGPHYAAAKGGIIALTKFWAQELLPHGIRVNAVAPAMTDTDMANALWPGPDRAALERHVPMGRFARPEEVAAVILFLASEESTYITGECLNVTGGF